MKSKLSVSPALVDGERDRQRLVDDAVGIDEGLRAVDAVGNGGDVGAHQLGGAAADLGDRRDDRVVAVAVEQLGQPLARRPSARPPGP